jgi:tartrate-resistant acid phosphatase type 5
MQFRVISQVVCAALVAASCSDDGGAGEGSQGPGTTAAASTGGGAGSTSSQPTTAGTAVSDTGGGMTGGNTATTTGTPGTTGQPVTTGGPQTTAPDTTGSQTSGPDTTGGETTGGTGQVVRFVVLGDTGEGNEDQFAVADAIVAVCEQKGCDFGVLTGDNFYDSGVSGVDDPQWQTKFEEPYADITFPMFAVLGNHDYGGNGIGVDFDTDKPDYQVQYTQVSNLWTMPARYYSNKQGPAEFWFLDTNQVMTDPINGDSEDQQDWLTAGIAASTAPWKFAFGHHPYISNGDHGNAGSYENLEGIPLPFVTGDSVKEFMEEAVCGQIDVYICGHDHNIQWLEAKCGTEFIVSGSGSKANTLSGNNPNHFQAGETEGFIWLEVSDTSFTGVFYDKTGKELYSRVVMK